MRAQVVLTPTESKCLIAKAIANMDVVKKAAEGGTIIVHASSTSYFLVKELTGDISHTDHWVHGGIFPQGLCTEIGASHKAPPVDPNAPPKKFDVNWFPFKWVIKNHKMTSGTSLGQLMDEIGPDDVYVKGCNAVDTSFNAGVLFGHDDGGGTIARIAGEQARKNFTIICAVGLEKLIPVSILEAAKATARKSEFAYAMGMACGLFPVKAGKTVTEIQAVDILSGAKAIPIAAGGLAGAEGGVVLSIEGEDEQVKKMIEIIEQCKGARLPQVRPVACNLCSSPDCHFPVKDKHWYPRFA